MGKEMITENKNNNIYKILIIILSIITGILSIAFIITTTLFTTEEPIEFSDTISILSDGKNESKEDDKTLYPYGIMIDYYFDYKKHPKYEEWIELYGLDEDCIDENEKRNSGYYLKLNNAIYESIKDYYSKFEFSNSEYSQGFMLVYSCYNDNETIIESKKILEKIKKEFFHSDCYKKTIELSKESYINDIHIIINSPISYHRD